MPADGPVQPRFVIEQRAIRIVPESDTIGAAHAIGLPLDQVVAPGEDEITFHNLSVTLTELPGVPAWSGQAHLVSVRDFTGLVMWAAADPDGRLRLIRHEHDEDDSLRDLNELLDAGTPQATGAAELLPFDDQLTYANQHVFMTPDVIGVAGGPPIASTIGHALELTHTGSATRNDSVPVHLVRQGRLVSPPAVPPKLA